MKRPRPTILDRFIGWLSPHAGFERARWRAYTAASRSVVDAVASDRLRSEWTNKIRDADAAHANRDHIRNVVRDVVLQNPFASGAVDRIVANVVGRGIRPQCRLRADTPDSRPADPPSGWRPVSEAQAAAFQTAAETLFSEFAEAADVRGQLNFYGLQEVVQRQLINDGESLVHLPRLKTPGRPTTFGLDLIEVDRLGTPLGKSLDKNVRDGVEIDPATGQPVAYWLRDTHPGDTKALSMGKYTRVPRFTDAGQPQILHLYYHRRPGQTRGISEFTPALSIVEDLHRYWEAEIVAARVAACYTAFVESPAAWNIQQHAGDTNTAGQREEEMEPGKIWYGQPGEKITFGNPQRPNAQLGQFTEILLRALGVALGLPYELIALNFSTTTYSSSRTSALEARRTFQSRQAYLTSCLCRHIWELVVREGILTGRLGAPGFAARPRDYLAAYWIAPAWGWVDPVKEETAARESIAGYLSTHSDELAAQGRDLDNTLEQVSREHKKLKTLGLPSPWDAVAPPQATGAVAAEQEIKDALAD